MNRRTFLMSSLATIGTGLFLSKKGKAFNKKESVTIIHIGDFHHEERSLVSIEWVQNQYYKGTIKRRWIPKEYLYGKHYHSDMELGTSSKAPLYFITGKAKPNYKIFIDTKDGGKYMQEINPSYRKVKQKDYITFSLFGPHSYVGVFQ